MSDLRNFFWHTVATMAKKNKDIYVLTGDLGYPFIDNVKIQETIGDRFVNCGIAEQNMVGVSAGLALAGKKVFVYSNTLFLLMRALEQVRDDVAYPNLDVTLIGTGASGFLGYTHNRGDSGAENLLFGVPNIKIFNPKDEDELFEAMNITGPSFVQL